jgi:hypothetical protein
MDALDQEIAIDTIVGLRLDDTDSSWVQRLQYPVSEHTRSNRLEWHIQAVPSAWVRFLLLASLVSQAAALVAERSSDIPNISQKWDRLIPKPKRFYRLESSIITPLLSLAPCPAPLPIANRRSFRWVTESVS